MYKKIIAFILFLVLFSFSVNANEVKKPKISSSAYVLYNPKNNEVVDSINAKQKMYPASLTKMLTALVVMDNCQDIKNEKVTVSNEAIKSLYGTSSSTAGLLKGEIYTVEQLLHLLLMRSGNDAANALAEHFSTDSASFAQLMNKKAKSLGMKNSNFVNPHGLHDDKHFTTATDLAILATAYSKNSVLANISLTKEYTIPKTNLQPSRDIKTTNFMLVENSGYYYQYTTGLKTGNTDEAGRCLAASAQKGDVKYICILLNCPTQWLKNGPIRTEFLEAASIFEYAFENYKEIKLLSKGEKLGKIIGELTYDIPYNAVLKENYYATLPKNVNLDSLKLDFKFSKLTEDNKLPKDTKKGDLVGKLTVTLDSKALTVLDGVAEKTVKPHWWLLFWDKIDFYVYLILGIIGTLILLFVVFVIRFYCVIYKRQKEKLARIERRRRMQEEFSQKGPIDYFNFN